MGYLHAATSAAMHAWRDSHGPDTATEGAYLLWLHVNGPASVTGTCRMPTITGHGDDSYESVTTYDMQLGAGWNMLRVEITALPADPTGRQHASRISTTSIDAMPDDAIWYFSPLDKP